MQVRNPSPELRAATLAAVLDAFARRDLAAAANCFAAGGTYREPRKPAVRGRDAISAHFARFAASGPRWDFVVDEVLDEGSHARVRYRFALEGAGHPRRERAGCATVRFDEHGRIEEWREHEG